MSEQRLPKCLSLLRIGNPVIMSICGEPAEYWDCSEPEGGPVCERHACARHGGKRKLSQDRINDLLLEELKYAETP